MTLNRQAKWVFVLAVLLLFFWVVNPFALLIKSSQTVTPISTVQSNDAFKALAVAGNNHRASVMEKPVDTSHSSLRGTEVDRPRIQVRDQQLVLNGTVLFYFDYFLSLQGEKSLSDIQSLLQADVMANYPSVIAEQLYALFLRYCDYLAEVARREAQVTEDDIREQQLSAKAMQEEVQHAFFSQSEMDALFTDYDSLLGGGSKAVKQQEQYEHFQQQVKDHPEQFEQIAQQVYGAQAANNLRNVQYQRQQWQGRVANYQRELRQIEESYRLDEQGLKQSVALLKHRHFSDTEIKRLDAVLRLQNESLID